MGKAESKGKCECGGTYGWTGMAHCIGGGTGDREGMGEEEERANGEAGGTTAGASGDARESLNLG